MSEAPLQVMGVIASLHANSVTRAVVREAANSLQQAGCTVDLLDLANEPLPLFNPENARQSPGYPGLRERVLRADAYILGTPDYHGGPSGAMKNFLDHFWHEFAGKLFGTIVASHEKGLTVTDQLRTIVRQCYGWSLPYGVSFIEKVDVVEGQVVSDNLRKRLGIFARDLRVYGAVLARQRRADISCADNCFMARHRV